MTDTKFLTTEMNGVVLEITKTVSDPERGSIQKRVRPRAGRKMLGMVLDAMNDGHTVSMRTHYDKEGTELLDAAITWDGYDSDQEARVKKYSEPR